MVLHMWPSFFFLLFAVVPLRVLSVEPEDEAEETGDRKWREGELECPWISNKAKCSSRPRALE